VLLPESRQNVYNARLANTRIGVSEEVGISIIGITVRDIAGVPDQSSGRAPKRNGQIVERDRVVLSALVRVEYDRDLFGASDSKAGESW